MRGFPAAKWTGVEAERLMSAVLLIAIGLP